MPRPKLPEGTKRVTCSVVLAPAEIERLKANFGSVNAGVRRLVLNWMEGEIAAEKISEKPARVKA